MEQTSKFSEISSETISKDGTRRGSNPKSRSNLKPFQKGQSGNPSGKQRGIRNYNTLFETALEKISIKYVDYHNSKPGNKEIYLEDVDIETEIIIQLILKARSGDVRAIIYFLDRMYGKPVPASSWIHTQHIKPDIDRELEIKKAGERLKKFQSKWFKA